MYTCVPPQTKEIKVWSNRKVKEKKVKGVKHFTLPSCSRRNPVLLSHGALAKASPAPIPGTPWRGPERLRSSKLAPSSVKRRGYHLSPRVIMRTPLDNTGKVLKTVAGTQYTLSKS